MSTYNGAKYLREQIDSVLCQIDVELSLIIRDDLSSDETKDILLSYKETHNNITVIYGRKNLGPCLSFIDLIQSQSDYDYYALADQDDIWNEDKLITAIEALSSYGNVPALYHSNLTIADETGKACRISHSKPRDLKNKYAPLISFSATGCTIVYNAALAKLLAEKRPTGFSMHDTYLVAVASLFGKVVYDFSPHILYRQHSENVIGTYTNKKTLSVYISRFKSSFCSHKHPMQHNAKVLRELFADDLSNTDIEVLEEIINYDHSLISKVKLLLDKRLKGIWRKRDIINVLLGQL